MIRPSEKLKPLFEQAAEALIAESSRDRLPEILSAQGLHLAAGDDAPPQPTEKQHGVKVGIWRERIEGGEKWFVREPLEPLRLWADVERIPPKGPRTRVVVLGESAARGYFYDPHFSFAAALRAVLAFAGAEDVEIVDLARTDTVLPRLTELMLEAVSLEPDVLVVFAGNNWMLTHDPPNFSMDEIASILSQGGGVAEIRAHCEDILRGLARTFIKTAAGIAAERGIPTIFALPEFNLMDWHNEKSDQTPFRSSEETASWEAARKAANRALRQNEIDEAEKMASRMIALDNGTTPSGYEILAQCALRRSRLRDVRIWLELAKDAGLFLPVMRSPRCSSVVQDVVRREALANGISLVDLPNIFVEYLSGELPDRRLFLDYCHLSVDGLRVAAASVTERLLSMLGRATRPWSELSQVDFNVPPRVLAEALFQASIHNSHWGQGPEVVSFQCCEALRLDPSIGDTMLRFIDSSLRRAPSFICASMEEVARDAAYQGAAALHLFNSLPPLRKNLNMELVGAVVSALTPFMPGLRETADRLMMSEFCVGNAECDLLHRAYSSTSLEDWDWLNGTISYRARQPESIFKLICCSKFPVGLKLTLRSRHLAANEQMVLKVNGIVVESLSVAAQWQSYEIEIPAEVLTQGINSLSILWPPQYFSRQDRMRTIGRELELGRIPTVPFIYGELSQLRAAARFGQENSDGCGHTPVFWPEVAVHLAALADMYDVAAVGGSGVSGHRPNAAALWPTTLA